MNMKQKICLTTLLIGLFATSILCRPSFAQGTSVKIVPSTGYSWRYYQSGPIYYFNVDVNISDVTDLVGWEIGLFWKNTDLNCDSYIINGPTWNDNITAGDGLNNAYNATYGNFNFAIANCGEDSFNGTSDVLTLTFHQLATGSTGGTPTYFTFDSVFTELIDSSLNDISFTTSNGTDIMHSGYAPE